VRPHVQAGSVYPSDGGKTSKNTAKITVLRHKTPIGKRFTIEDGRLKKTSIATFFDGTAKVIDAPDAAALVAILDRLHPHEVVSLGVLKNGRTEAPIKTARRAAAGDATRSLDHFEHRNGEGWLLLDHDTKTMPEDVATRVAEYGGGLAAIEHIWPELKSAARVVRPSSSGGVYIKGEDPAAATGFHLFTLVSDVAKSREYLDILMARAWEAGLAWFFVGKSGALLERSIIDALVGGPERLVFTAPPELGPGIYRDAPAVQWQGGAALDLPAKPVGSGWARAQQAARRRMAGEAAQVRAEYIGKQADKLAKDTGKSKADALRIITSRIEGRILDDDDVLETREGQRRVGDILDTAFTSPGGKMAVPDPVEPDLSEGTKAAIIWKAGYREPVLISHAHGVLTKYRFARHMDEDALRMHHDRRAQEQAVERGAMPPPADLEDGKASTLQAALQSVTDRDDAMAVALAVIGKRLRRTPFLWSEDGLMSYIIRNIPADVLDDEDIKTLKAIIARRNYARRRAALGVTEITSEAMRRVWNSGTVTNVLTLNEARVDLYGTTAVKAPMGEGKTQEIGAPWVAEARKHGTVVAICHRVTLVDELSVRLDLPHYRTCSPEDVLEAGGVAVCLPSILSRLVAGTMPQPDFVVIDEVAQTLQFLESKECCRAGGGNAEDVFNALVKMVRGAKGVLVMDAGLDTRSMEFLTHCRGPNVSLILMKPKPTQKTARIYPSPDPRGIKARGHVLDDIRTELLSGGRVYVTTDSAKTAKDIGAVLGDAHKVLVVTAETKETADVAAFLRDADKESRRYDALIVSPAVVSGISIEHRDKPHFTLGADVFCGQTITPADALQQIRRVRYLDRFVMALSVNQGADGQTREAIVKGDIDAADIDGNPVTMSLYDHLRADIQAERANACADFAAGLFWMLERDGWSLENAGEVTKKGAGAADLKDAKETREAAWHHALMTAEIPDPETADMLRRRKTDDRDRARLEAFNIVTTLAVHKVTQQAIDTWDEGRMAAKVARFEDLLNIGDLPPVESQKLIERDGRLARRKMLRGLFDNIDLTSDCPFTPETQRVFIDRLMAQHDAFVAVGLLPAKWRSKRTKAGKLTPPARPKSFGPVLKDIAERLGLQVIERRERVAQKHAPLYKVIQSDTFSGHPEKVRVFGIDPESWQMMMSIIERRKEPPKPWETPTCLEDLTLEELGIGRHDISDLIGPSVLAGFGSAVASFRIGEALERFPIGAVLRAEHKRRRSLW
jgi:putative DNA primase/helicase